MFETRLTFDDAQLRSGLAGYPSMVNSAVANIVDAGGDVGTAYMKQNAPWRDETGNARSGLHAVAFHEGDTHTLVLAHGVPYGIWLEVRFGGRYAIIPQSIQYTGQWIMAQLRG